ncbi:MAG: SDR family NAD(P)-dependent oxidoreductase [Alphaproteobacteria bacterium]|nr:SDR family NAD(P)-dependent oxidoreductase [Alphaproteobacteria bacterium]
MADKPGLLITGASSGIGEASARVAVARGARVYASVRKPEDGARLVAALGDDLVPVVFDVTDEAAVAVAARKVADLQNGKRLLGVLNNAGGSVPGPLLHMSAAELRAQMEVNLIGVHNVTTAFAPLLGCEGVNQLGEGKPGRFVMISSVGGKRAVPFIAAYAASKFALEGYSEGLRRELMPFGVDVIVIGPGAVKTAIWDKGLSFDQKRYANSIYAPILAKFTDAVAAQAAGGLDAEKVGALVWRVLTEEAPKTRYAIVPNWLTDIFLPGFFSPRALDRIIAKRFGLSGSA